ncbi:MAG TPA: sulfurtransferase [Thermomicrobiales bacterium]|nr:sulfurtransferase [Thermomicrobiales bacterium]
MTSRHSSKRPVLSRRHALQIAIGGSTGLALLGKSSALHAQPSPHASPTAEHYAHPEMLIDAHGLEQFRIDPVAILVGFMPEEDFDKAHIPGSVQLDWPALEVTDTSDESIAQWREQASQTLASFGIAGERPVLAYDAGTLFAARLWWVLHYLGHEDKQVLNGGLSAWQQATGEVATDATPAGATASSAVQSFQGQPRAGTLAQLEEVRASLDDPNVVIVDARTPDEYSAGHIPGAVNINYPRNATSEMPKVWKPVDELREMYEEVGVTPDKHVIPYCSTGVRSAVTFFTLRLIGYENVALYTGSWKEWGDHPDTPKPTGTEP